MAAKGNEL